MPLAPLLLSVRDTVRIVLQLSSRECDCQGGPKPPTALFNQQYVSIYPWGWMPGDTGELTGKGGLHYDFGVGVCITKQIGLAPPDRRFDTEYLNALDGFEVQIRLINQSVHQNWNIITKTNELSTYPQSLYKSLEWIGGDVTPQDQTGEWLGSKSQSVVCQTMETRFAHAMEAIGVDPNAQLAEE
jgi:hypothetical protein